VCVFEDFVMCGCFSGFCNVWVIYDVCVFDDFVMCERFKMCVFEDFF